MRSLKNQQKEKPDLCPQRVPKFAALVLQCQVYFYLLIAHQLHARFPKELLAGEATHAPQQEYGCAGNRATLREFIQLFLPAQSCKIAIIEHFKETTIVGALGAQTQPKTKCLETC